MSPEFDDWWNSDYLPPNPYPKDSPVFWAWAGWQMAVKAEREACAKVCEPQSAHDDPLTAWKIATAIRERGQEPPR